MLFNSILKRNSLNYRFLRIVIPISVLSFIFIFFIFEVLITNISNSLSERFVGQKVIYDKGRMLSPLLNEVNLAKNLAKNDTIIQWALDEQDTLKKINGLTQLETFRKIFKDQSYFFVIEQSGNYYFNDAKNQYQNNQLRYTLSESKEKDSWYYATKKSPKDCQLNVNNDPELSVTKVWINCLVKHQHKIIGIIGTGIDLSQYVQEVLVNHDNTLLNMIVDKNGAIQAHPNIENIDFHSISKEDADKKTIYNLIHSPKERNELKITFNETKQQTDFVSKLFIHINGIKTLIGISYIQEFDWFNLTLVKTDTWSLGKFFVPLAALVFGSIILIFFISTLINHKLVLSRIYHLNHATNKIKLNEFTLDLKDESSDEIGQLSNNFIEMTNIIQQKQSELFQAKIFAEQANQIKSQFLSNLSHETRTPMSIILGMTDLALKKGLEGKERNYVEKANTAARNLSQLIEKMLDFSEIEAGKKSINAEKLDLDSFLNELKLNFDHEALAKQITITVINENEPVDDYYADKKHLHTALSELLENAIKFTPNEGEVFLSVSTEPLGDDEIGLHFKVKDTGIGISEEQKHHLFQLFFQIDGSNTRKFGGVGLGLIYAKTIIESMNGKIWVESEPGEGSTFHLEVIIKKHL